ncbi:MAG: T9SS type A sorting domain-containing protein [Bacteroidia bacterium]|nr:T9SS type A sorting domain-containing protein [Bacteroidia bacterium]
MLGYSLTGNPIDPFGVIAAGTLVTSTNTPSDTADIEILEYDRVGKVAWSARINGGTNEYCYNVNSFDFGGTNSGYILSGASLQGGIIRPHVWLVDRFGNLLAESPFVSSNLAGNALHAFQTQDGNIIVSGFYYAGTQSGSSKQGIVLKLNQSLNVVWRKFINTSATQSNDWDMCEFGIETSSGYFITGSRNQSASTGGTKSVMAIWLNKTTGAIAFDRSFKTTSSSALETGASAAYDAAVNKLYVLSNNSSTHGFMVTVFNGTTLPATNRRYSYLDLSFIDAYGYSIKIDNSTTNVLTVAGLKAGVNVIDAQGNTVMSKIPFIAELNLTTGAVNFDRCNEVPGGGLNNFGTPFMSLGNSSTMPEIFTPELLISRRNNEHHYLGYRREYNSDIRLELIKSSGATEEPPCTYLDVMLTLQSNNITSQTAATAVNGTLTIPARMEVVSELFPKSQINCFEAPCGEEVANAGPDGGCVTSAIGTPAIPGATYAWSVSPAGLTLSSGTIAQPIVISVASSTQQYTITLTMTNRCGEVSTDQLLFTGFNCRLANPGAGQQEANSSANVFPNPGNGTFTFSYQAEETDVVQVQILDMSGRQVAVRSLTASGQQLSFDELADGIYIYQLTINNKMVKQDRLIINR